MKYYYTNSLERILQNVGDRRIILYGTDLLSQVIYDNLKHMDREIEFFVDDVSNENYLCNREIRHPYDLLYEDKCDIYILVFTLENHGVIYNNSTFPPAKLA